MNDSEAQSLEQVRTFLAGCGGVQFAGQSRAEVYDWVERTLVRHQYAGLGRTDKGTLRQYLERMTGLSRAQITRLITMYADSGHVTAAAYRRRKFPALYTRADVQLLAYVDKAHSNLSGPAVKRILEREYEVYRQNAYQRLASISVAQIYRFRGSSAYRKINISYQPTRPVRVPIGERRKPQPNGLPGYLRIDTVHQGDRDGIKGLYHINAVDEVTQWEIVAATPVISEWGLLPILEDILRQFPFIIRGFHSDNGSEFINYGVAGMLEKLLIQQTRSRAHRSGDNGLVEAKNGAVIRKHVGFGPIGAQHADAVNQFHRDFLNPYLNFHRPCAVPKIITQPNGKRRRIYTRWATPLELLREIKNCSSLLRSGVSLSQLNQLAQAHTDTEAAVAMQTAKRRLMLRIAKKSA